MLLIFISSIGFLDVTCLDYYVRESGIDTQTCTSSSPCKTLNASTIKNNLNTADAYNVYIYDNTTLPSTLTITRTSPVRKFAKDSTSISSFGDLIINETNTYFNVSGSILFEKINFIVQSGGIVECKAKEDGGGICADILSGSILTIDEQCQFIDCYADEGGGLFAWIHDSSSLLTLQECLFRGCKSGGGAYVYSYIGAQLNKVTFENCSSYRGGGIYFILNNLTQLVINGSTFNSCRASSYGGGIYLEYYSSSLEFIDTTFFNCSAEYYGGGMCIKCYSKNSIFTITSNSIIFKECSAIRGGGIYIDLAISNQSLSYPTGFGGGIFLVGYGDYDVLSNRLDFKGMKIFNNSATNGGQNLYVVMTKLQEWCQYGNKGEYVKGNYSDSTSYLCELEGIPINFTTFNSSTIDQIKQQQKQLEQFWNEDIDENKLNCPFPIDCTDLSGKTEQECACIDDDTRIDICTAPIDCTDVSGKTKHECPCLNIDIRYECQKACIPTSTDSGCKTIIQPTEDTPIDEQSPCLALNDPRSACKTIIQPSEDTPIDEQSPCLALNDPRSGCKTIIQPSEDTPIDEQSPCLALNDPRSACKTIIQPSEDTPIDEKSPCLALNDPRSGCKTIIQPSEDTPIDEKSPCLALNDPRDDCQTCIPSNSKEQQIGILKLKFKLPLWAILTIAIGSFIIVKEESKKKNVIRTKSWI
ncbi:MAG: hypothetical protein EZS28_007493 [Streblomastix strix]|uniref:Right handed beta helix domain-containing protein n=1 Tax=Streblomastix strix TaxID=222440 RepID=A0A5J4WQG6_9EUKA|nr:MAG: hypothetical protein EZS28_007493 [Streblomastix strix]